MSESCQFCGNNFSSKKTLRQHQQAAKYCLDIQNEPSVFECNTCKKIYQTKRGLERHRCSQVKIELYTTLKGKYDNLKQKFKEDQLKIIKFDKENEGLKSANQELEKEVERLAHIIEHQPPIINSKTEQNNNVIINMPNFGAEQFISAIQDGKLTSELVEKGGLEGVVRFIAECCLVTAEDGSKMYNYMVSDNTHKPPSFKSFESPEWKLDKGGRKLVEFVYPALIDPLKEILETIDKRLLEEYDWSANNNFTQDRKENVRLMGDTTFIYNKAMKFKKLAEKLTEDPNEASKLHECICLLLSRILPSISTQS